MLKPDVLKNAALATVLGLFAAIIVAHALAESLMLHDDVRNSILLMADGTAERPYVYRDLLPLLARAITAITPKAMQWMVADAALSAVDSAPFAILAKHSHWEGYSRLLADLPYLYPVIVMGLLMVVSLLAYGLGLRKLSNRFFPADGSAAWATAFAGLAVLAPFVDVDLKVYDFPLLALFTLCLLAMQARAWGAYLLYFTFACVNKETALLYVGLFAVVFYAQLERRFFWALLLAQLAILAAAVGMAHGMYAGNPGKDNYFHPRAFIAVLFEDLRDPAHLLVLAALYALVARRWRELPPLLKSCLWVFAADVLVYYLFGKGGEYRVFFDAFPGLTIIAGHSLFSLGKEQKT